MNYFFKKNPINKKTQFEYPLKIDKYNLSRVLFPDYKHRSYKYAIYKQGQKNFFAKIWTGDTKNFDYNSLINEINVYKNFVKFKKKDPLFFKNQKIKIPELEFYCIQEKFVVLLIEHIVNKNYKKNDSKILSIYLNDVLFFLRNVTESFGKFSKLKPKSLKFITIIYIFFLAIILIKRPKLVFLLGRCLFRLLKYFIYLFQEKNNFFVHRSLEGQNIILNKKNIYLIDFQLLVLSHPLLDIAQIIAFYPKIEFVDYILKIKYLNNYYSDLRSKKLLSLLTIYSCLVQLALTSSLSKERIKIIDYFLSTSEI